MKDKKEKSNNLRVNALEQREKEREKRNKAVQDALQSKVRDHLVTTMM